MPIAARCGLRTLPVEAAQVAEQEGNHESTGSLQAGGGDRLALNRMLESIMASAVQWPVLTRIGNRMGINFDDAESGKGPDRKG